MRTAYLLTRRMCYAILLFIVCSFLPFLAASQDAQSTEDQMIKKANENIEKFRKGEVTLQFKTQDGKVVQNASVEIIETSHDFLFGCIIFDLIHHENTYREDLFKQQFKKIFNLAVFPFYWPGYESRQGMPEWSDMLPVIEWCHANGITTKGHPLVWATESGAPQWLSLYSVTESEELLKSRVVNTVAGFRDNINMWDVVNEPINVKTWEHKMQNLKDNNDWGIRDSIPLIADYVEQALRWAHQSNPRATLIVNEYQTLANPETRKRFDDLLTELQKRDAPISGIGIQAHEPRQEWFSPVEMWKTFDQYGRFGIPIYITEFHPQSSGVPITGPWRSGKWTPEVQAYYTKLFITLCFGHPAVASVNWWGFSDRNIWLPGGGLVDEEYRPKPVYNMLDSLINISWTTRIHSSTGNLGAVNFRGFFGNYDIKLTTRDGKVYFYHVHVAKNEENKWGFTVENFYN